MLNQRQGMMLWTMCNVKSSIGKGWCLAKDSGGCYELSAMWTVQLVKVGA